MPRLPDYTALGAPPSLRPPGAPNVGALVGRGVQRAANIAADYARDENPALLLSHITGRLEEMHTARQAERQAAESATALAEVKGNLPLMLAEAYNTALNQAEPGAKDFAGTVQRATSQRVNDFLTGVRKKYALDDESFEEVRASAFLMATPYQLDAINHEHTERRRLYASTLTQQLEAVQLEAYRNPDRLGDARAKTRQLLEGARSHLPPSALVELERTANRELSMLAIRGRIQADPGAALDTLMSGEADQLVQMGGRLEAEDFRSLQSEALTTFEHRLRQTRQERDREEQALEDARKEAADAIEEEGLLRASRMELTREWIEENRDVLDASQTKSLLTAWRNQSAGGEDRDDPETYRDIYALIAENRVGEARELAFQSHEAGLIRNSTLSKVLGATKPTSADAPPDPYKQGLDVLRSRFARSGGLVPDPAEAIRQADAITEYNARWQQELTAEESLELGRDIASRYQIIDIEQTGLSLPQPEVGAIDRLAPPDQQRAVIERYARELDSARRDPFGTLTGDQIDRDFAILERWLDYVERRRQTESGASE